MNKIVIKLFVPCLEQEFDVKIPKFLTVGELTPLLARSVTVLSNGKYCTNGKEILCIKDRKLFLDYRYQISEYGIQNGDQLMMF